MITTISGAASLDLMLGHTFYNRPCLATGMLVHTYIYIIMVAVKRCKAIAKLCSVKACSVASLAIMHKLANVL